MFRAIVLLVVLAAVAAAQTAPFQNFAAAGVSWNQSATPAIAGSAAYARLLSAGTMTYSFTLVDALPTTVKPFTVTTQTSTGVLQRILAINGWDVLVPVAAGVSWTGQNTGWAWTTGGIVSIPAGKYRVLPNVRIIKSSVNNNSGYQVVVGVMFGGGW